MKEYFLKIQVDIGNNVQHTGSGIEYPSDPFFPAPYLIKFG